VRYRNLCPSRLRLIIGATLATAGILAATTPAQAADPVRYQTYYSIFERGQQHIPYLDTTPYVPQGLAYWPEQDAMIVSYYHTDGGRAIIAILDRTTSTHLKTLYLDDSGHAGGLAMSGTYLWVASGTNVIRYSKATLAQSADGAQLTRDRGYTLLAGSFIEVIGDKMYVGSFDPDSSGRAYRYTLDSGQNPVYDGHSFTVPSKVQGMAITSTHFVWSRSYGRDNDSELTVDPRSGPITRTVVAPNMSEDLAIVNGELYVVYESGALKYADADYKVRTIHHGPLAELIP
jgi:hypothetical protein